MSDEEIKEKMRYWLGERRYYIWPNYGHNGRLYPNERRVDNERVL